MNKMIWTGAIAGTLAVATAAVAFGFTSVFDGEQSSTRASNRQGPSSDSKLMQYDIDKDGRVSRSEMDASLTAEFRSVDANTDGRLDAAEIQRHIDTRRTERNARLEAWRAKARAQGLDPKRPPFDSNDRDNVDTLRYADWNMDGAITPEEFGGRARSQFMRADRNGDGQISTEELKRRGNNREGNRPDRAASSRASAQSLA
jgi:hypothetical protein